MLGIMCKNKFVWLVFHELSSVIVVVRPVEYFKIIVGMSLPEYNDLHSITVLKEHELLQIFGYLDHEELLKCRLVCSYWYQIIKHDALLMDQFRFSMTLNAGTIIAAEELPFSLIHKSKIKLESIKLQDDFLDPGSNLAVLEANRSKISTLSTIFTDINAMETINEVILHARDNEPHTSALLLKMIINMKNVKILRFTLTAFVHCLETICSTLEFTEQCNSVDHVQIMHTNGKQFIQADIERMLRVFPNIKRIDVTATKKLEINSNILETFAPLIKSIGVENLDLEDVSFLHEFLNRHREIETMRLKLTIGSSWFLLYFFPHPFHQISDLILKITNPPIGEQMEDDLKLGNILKYMPNLRKLCVKYKEKVEHEVGHEIIEMKNLVDVSIIWASFDCNICYNSMLESIVRVKSLYLQPYRSMSLKEITSMATTLEQLECLELAHADSFNVRNYFAEWPAMPKLKTLIVHRVGIVSDNGILNLQKNCPMLEVIKFYSLRGSYVNNLLKFTIESLPNIKAITFRGGRSHDITKMDYIKGKVGWRLEELDVSSYIKPPAISQLFKNCDFLETVRCKYGTVVVTRRIYYEAEILKAYTLKSIEQPLKNRKRLHTNGADSSDCGTSSDSGESSSESSDELDNDEDIEDVGSTMLSLTIFCFLAGLILFENLYHHAQSPTHYLQVLPIVVLIKDMLLISIFYNIYKFVSKSSTK